MVTESRRTGNTDGRNGKCVHTGDTGVGVTVI